MDSSKGVPRPAHSDKWDESNLPNKGLSGSTASSQSRPHATIAPLPRPDDSLTSSRGFQPYRGTEESRNTLPHHLSLFDHPHPAASYPYTPAFLPPPHLSHPAYRVSETPFPHHLSLFDHPHPAASYPYTPAFLPPPHLSHPAYRFDDPLYLERYSLLRPPVMPYPQPSMMAPPAAFYPNSRYAADLLAQSLSISSANNSILNHERLKQEEERRMREKEIELDQSRNKEQERLREKEHKEKESREREHKEREQREKEKKEREKSHREREDHKKSHNSNYSTSSKRTESPSVRNPPDSRDQQRHHVTKDNHTNDKINMRFSPSATNDKKLSNIPNIDPTVGDTKKHSSTDNKRFDTIHHHIAELSSKDHGPHEWRHEKLQKACTNNHRKSHESKKAKDDRSSVFQNHQRKTVNGAVLKPTPYQNEGMHARLLESEKCRLEMNGHTVPKAHAPSNANDRMLAPSFKSSLQPNTGKEVVPQKTFNDFYSTPLLKSNIDFTPVKFESNPQKLKFLQLLGLTTHFKRKKIEFDMYLKRRKVLREDSDIAPLENEPEPEDTSILPSVVENNIYTDRLAEQLRAETNPIKLEFLFKIGLTPITLVKKEEKERIQRIVDEEKIRRHYRMLANVNRKSSPRRLFVPKSETAQRLDHLRKLKEMNSISNGVISKHLPGESEDMMDIKYSSTNSLLTPKTEQGR
ncbi:DUF3736 domain-containing protein [Trichonephila inaurata madagascariensis]|uniref:DUF3736 domain-containing protein n=1 Tax=Trichonephila inaurata madagascariensis TaxID=2747483 RepID=A0A8X6YGN7_9ARAC|nr:DUF3736 domain-containing protein [Trichonephila inaurata madagascariensis]